MHLLHKVMHSGINKCMWLLYKVMHLLHKCIQLTGDVVCNHIKYQAKHTVCGDLVG